MYWKIAASACLHVDHFDARSAPPSVICRTSQWMHCRNNYLCHSTIAAGGRPAISFDNHTHSIGCRYQIVKGSLAADCGGSLPYRVLDREARPLQFHCHARTAIAAKAQAILFPDTGRHRHICSRTLADRSRAPRTRTSRPLAREELRGFLGYPSPP